MANAATLCLAFFTEAFPRLACLSLSHTIEFRGPVQSDPDSPYTQLRDVHVANGVYLGVLDEARCEASLNTPRLISRPQTSSGTTLHGRRRC